MNSKDKKLLPAILTFIELWEQGFGEPKESLSILIASMISKINDAIATTLNGILHHKEFQNLESSWKGLEFLLFETPQNEFLKFKVLCVNKRELLRDQEKAIEFDRSTLFKLVYESEFGTLGGEPFGILIGDYYFNRSLQDINLLGYIAQTCSAAHTMFLTGADPSLMDMKHFAELSRLPNLKKRFQSQDMKHWHRLRSHPDSRYIVLTVPRFLQRPAYGNQKNRTPCKNLVFEEDHVQPNGSEILWGNVAYILGHSIARSFSQTFWFSSFYGKEYGVINSLPESYFDCLDFLPKFPLEISIPEGEEEETLGAEGFIVCTHVRFTNECRFIGKQTLYKPIKQSFSKKLEIEQQMSSELPHMLVASRFAHYFKIMMRNKIGRFHNIKEVQQTLSKWLSKHILYNDTESMDEQQLAYPLKEGRIHLYSSNKKKNQYFANIYLKPRLQPKEKTIGVQLTTYLDYSS